jgi:integral membrane protein
MTGFLKGPQPLGGTAGALARYRVMAFIVGTGLAILCFVGIPLQVIGGNKWPWTAVVEIVGPVHGIFYIIYLLTCLDLAGRARFRTAQLLGMVCSGLVPLLAFYMEAKVTERVRRQIALGADAPPGPAATIWSVLSGRAKSLPGNAPVPGSPAGGEGDREAVGTLAGSAPAGTPEDEEVLPASAQASPLEGRSPGRQ